MANLIKLRAHPKLKSPIMVAAWPGVGNVATIIAMYLRRKLEFKELGEIEASHFFDPIGVAVKDNVVEAPQFPESKFYYLKNAGKKNDVILFVGDDQPTVKSYELANCVLDLGLKFQVKKIYTCAAAVTKIHHSEEPKVWGAATNAALTNELKEHNLIERGNLQIAGLNGLLLGVARERGIDGICLLGEVPSYATRIHNPMAALAILKVLSQILNVDIDMLELSQLADETKEKMKQLAAEAMEEYIDLFTEPIWEQGEEGEEGEEV
ncbi:MAG: PAC2 family protein [Chloroflexi bacterium]|nr:PAC2 family protein [Chloroflexota bacterium]